jgi:hypothetical protein
MIARRFAPLLWLLTGLFALRVVAQPAALLVESPGIPSFESWHGGLLPYPVLLVSQVLILGWLARTASCFGSGEVVANPRLGRVALALGGVYLLAMLVRLTLGLTALADVRWFASPVPTFFHLVLATYVLVWGYAHASGASPSAPRESVSVGDVSA